MSLRSRIGHFLLTCIDAERQREDELKLAPVGGDLDKLTDAQLSDFLHGRPIDWTAQGSVRVPLLGRIS